MLRSLSYAHGRTSVVGSTRQGPLEMEAECEVDFVWMDSQFILISSQDSLRIVLLALVLFSCTAPHRRAAHRLNPYVLRSSNVISFPSRLGSCPTLNAAVTVGFPVIPMSASKMFIDSPSAIRVCKVPFMDSELRTKPRNERVMPGISRIRKRKLENDVSCQTRPVCASNAAKKRADSAFWPSPLILSPLLISSINSLSQTHTERTPSRNPLKLEAIVCKS